MRRIMQIQLPVNVKNIINKLEEAGFEAFAVGGCVRDCLLGMVPKDWDITTSAKPEEVKAVFGHTIDTGIKHGTVTVMRSGTGYEITTYRVDGADVSEDEYNALWDTYAGEKHEITFEKIQSPKGNS